MTGPRVARIELEEMPASWRGKRYGIRGQYREVADLAGVSVTAVSNWRRRSPTFPAPTAGVRNGRAVWLFDPDEIHRWLTERETNR